MQGPSDSVSITPAPSLRECREGRDGLSPLHPPSGPSLAWRLAVSYIPHYGKGPPLAREGSTTSRSEMLNPHHLWEEHLPGPIPWPWACTVRPREQGSRGLTWTGAQPADPCRLRSLLLADPEAVVRRAAEHWPLLGAIATGYRALQVESHQSGPASPAEGLEGPPRHVTS